jgi:acetyl esterase/lipase
MMRAPDGGIDRSLIDTFPRMFDASPPFFTNVSTGPRTAPVDAAFRGTVRGARVAVVAAALPSLVHIRRGPRAFELNGVEAKAGRRRIVFRHHVDTAVRRRVQYAAAV